ncbi:uncharacterized protein LOC116294075 [Actinia tenebrosa]|uniref:Uncharacterized protein LOC116294075 n=1 Tax=Actinia tenebrosa TaxID=6105 RepID=A0A6P8HXY7_ACTTE|nr:uncharacterized protein LOC116294075 [Actinia tenebrosa]
MVHTSLYRIKRKNHQDTFIKSRTRINDGLWHKVLIRRTLSTLFVQIDSGTPRKKLVDRFFLRFHPGEMLLGGFPSQAALIKGSNWPTFQGSIRELMIGGKRVDIKNEVSSQIKARLYRTSSIH